MKLKKRRTAFLIGLLGLLVVSFQNCAPGFDAVKSTPAPLVGGTQDRDLDIPTFPADVPANPNGPLTLFVRNTAARQGDDLVFTIELNKASATDVFAQVETQTVSALPALDFTDTKAAITIPAGALSVKLTISGFVYSTSTSYKLMKLHAISATGAAIGQSDGAGLIKPLHKLESFKQTSNGYFHTCGITQTGTVRCWGMNSEGQLGNGTSNHSDVPVDVIGVAGATAISSGNGHTCALVTGGRIKCWGWNQFGQLGNGARTDSVLLAVDVVGLMGVKKIDAGGVNTCAVTAQDKVACWGSNQFGQLGTGTLIDASVPAEVQSLSGIVELSVGLSATCIINNQGISKCWGANTNGQLGNGSLIGSTTPVDVTSLTNAKSISVGNNTVCAITALNGVACWGRGTNGQLGNAAILDSMTAVSVTGLTGVTQLATGPYHSCAVTTSGAVKCWGRANSGTLGNGDFQTPSFATPQDVLGVTGATAVTLGFDTSCVVTTTGGVKCWGTNTLGQLGSRQARIDIAGLSSIREVANGQSHSCALTSTGTVKCWGFNSFGALGNGTVGGYTATGVDVLGVTGATQISVGTNHSCALVSMGKVKCWGQNLFAQVAGNNALSNHPTAVELSGLSGVKQVAAAGESTCAITATDTVKCWGGNFTGQLGIGNKDDVMVPSDVVGLTGVTQISSRYRHVCALTDLGEVRCWGFNSSGQAGDGTVVDNATATAVAGLTGVKKISVGDAQSCAVTANDTVKCWGEGPLGNNTDVNSSVPVDVLSLAGVKSIAVGRSHSCALTSTGVVKCWGETSSGEFGKKLPTQVFVPADGVGFEGTEQLSVGVGVTNTIRTNGGVRQFGSLLQYSAVAVDVTSVVP